MARSRNKKTEIEEEIEKRIPTTRYNPDYKVGLTAQQVQEHRLHGWVNRAVDPPSKTTKEIVHENVFTYFNLIFLVLAILLCLVGSFRNLTFLPVIIANTLIGIIQEVRAKKVLDNLTMLNAPKATVVRDGKRSLIDAEELVVDDIVIFKAGAQVCADAQVCAGEVQVNESLLTGESDEITKHAGDQLMSGSFIISGQCHARLDKVGEDSYISKLTLEAKEMQNGEQSEMIRSLDKLVKCVGVAIIPIGIILVAQSLVFQNASFHSSITSMVAAVIGMIPEGLYLLASVALAVSSIRLAQQKVLLHDMKCIETLARVDVLCVDKTGTITENTMKVQELIPTEQYDTEKMGSLRLMVGDFVSAMTNDNITMAAMKEYFTHSSGAKAISKTGFSSATKYSSATFEDKTYVLGAPEFVLLDDYEQHKEKITELASTGARVLVFGTYAAEIDGKALTEPVTPLGYILLANPIREAAKETFQYFAEQGVEVKVISGDNPVTVSKVAKTAGIKNAENYVDASSLETEEDIKKLADAQGKSVETIKAIIESLKEFNPMMGHRGCRLTVTYPEIAVMQTKAVIRAALAVQAKHADWTIVPEIMIPLVGEEKELKYVKKIVVKTADEEIKAAGSDMKYEVGTMIEIPRAALLADEIAKEAEFFCFGTNDLTQMTFGFSRDDAGKFLDAYYDAKIFENDPFAKLDQNGVGKLMDMAVKLGKGQRPELHCGICGEHGGDPSSVEFCHRIGLDYVSCSPFRVPIARLAAAQAAIAEKRK
mgnify:CR=1 FL=1